MRHLSSEAARAMLREHALVRAHPRIGEEGFALPEWPEGAVEIPLEPETAETLKAHGVQVEGEPGAGNRVLLPARGPHAALRLRFGKGRPAGNLFALGPCAPNSQFHVKMSGGGHAFIVAGGIGRHSYTVSLRTGEALFFMGRDGFTDAGNALVEGPGTGVVIGDGCMIARGADLRTSDSHAIIDLEGGVQVNLPEGVVLGPHVWLAVNAVVMKGTEVGRGSIVAAQGMVTKDVPPFSLMAGVPARQLRGGVSWTRASNPGKREIAELRDSLGYAAAANDGPAGG